MATRFLCDDRIVFLAGRHFAHGGHRFVPGEEITNARQWPNLESAVRSRHLVAVADDLEQIPHLYRRDVKNRAQMEAKLGLEQNLANKPADLPAPEQPEQPSGLSPEMTIKDILDYLGFHPEQTEGALEMERHGKNRPRLIHELEERLTTPEEEIDV